MADLVSGDKITIDGVFDDHLLTIPSRFIVTDVGPNRVGLENENPKMRGRHPYYDESKNTVKNPPHPFPNGYPRGR